VLLAQQAAAFECVVDCVGLWEKKATLASLAPTSSASCGLRQQLLQYRENPKHRHQYHPALLPGVLWEEKRLGMRLEKS
jgi:hypothetical protein